MLVCGSKTWVVMLAFTWHSPVSMKVYIVLDTKDERECQEDTATEKTILGFSATACFGRSTDQVQFLPQLSKRFITFVIRHSPGPSTKNEPLAVSGSFLVQVTVHLLFGKFH